MRHKITVEELTDWLKHDDPVQVAASFSDFSAKTLSATPSSPHTFVVTDHDKEIYRGGDMEAAIAAYNSAP